MNAKCVEQRHTVVLTPSIVWIVKTFVGEKLEEDKLSREERQWYNIGYMTLKQKKAIKNMVLNGGNATKAMLDAGYSPNTAHSPDKLTKSEGFKEIMDKYLGDDLLVRKHSEALDATKWNDFTGEREYDHATRLKAVELGYKLKKRLGPEIMQQFNTGEMTLEFTDGDK